MGSGISIDDRNREIERNAYNAAFHELGFRWHWDSPTYSELLSPGLNADERIGHDFENDRRERLLRHATRGRNQLG